jgi:hypothetical protein
MRNWGARNNLPYFGEVKNEFFFLNEEKLLLLTSLFHVNVTFLFT